MREQFRILRDTFLPCLYSLLGVAVFVFTFGIGWTTRGIPYPYPTLDSIAASVLRNTMDKLVPETVEVITLSPFNAFLVLLGVSLAIGLVITFPLFFCKLIHYLRPALYQHERRGLLRLSIPSSLLFTGGALFAYFLVIPQTFAVLYRFAGVIEVGEMFHLSQFVGLVLGLVVVVGIMFQLPIAMILLTKFAVVGETFWRGRWKHALVGILIITAIITPDGSGITMAILSLPLAGLYVVGMKLSESKRRKSNVGEVQEAT